ncbi:MAG: hypothetical protein QXT81_06230 [Candidatus Bathyarchaeia archaeon]
MNWVVMCESLGAVFAFASILYSVFIMTKIRRGASTWIFLGITSFSMFFSMLLGVVGAVFPVDPSIQRLEQYIFMLAGAFAFALGGVTLHGMFVYKEG